MSGLLLAVRVGLALILAVAGVGKLSDRAGSRVAVTAFGVPAAIAGPVAGLLPFLELGAAILLIPSATAVTGSIVAMALMLAFSAAIARSIARGEAPDCHCFGAIHSEPAGPRTLARNLLLAALAAVAVAGGPGASATAWLGTISAGWTAAILLGVILVAVLAGGGVFALRLLRRHGELLLRIDTLEETLERAGVAAPAAERTAPTAGLPVGTPAPAFALPDLAGGEVTLSSLRTAGDPLLLLFTDPSCGPCAAMLPRVAAWQRERPGGLRPVLISRGPREANASHAADHGLRDVLIQSDREVSERFAIAGTPGAVVIETDGLIGSAVHAGEEEIAMLIEGRARPPAPGLRTYPGAPAPGLRTHQGASTPGLRTLEGAPTTLAEHLAGNTLLVFWNPACGFCSQMIDRLREIDAAHPHGGLIVVSTGSPAANRELALLAPVLLDDTFSTGTELGVAGTPSAVRVDQDGVPISAVALGAEAVIALAGAPAPAADRRLATAAG